MNDIANAQAADQMAAPAHAAAVVTPVMAAAATPAQGATPAASSAGVAQPPAEPQRPAGNAQDANTPAWLPDRLKAAKATAQRELLEASGFKSAEELTTALAELKRLKDEKLTDSERKDQHIKDLEGKAGKLESIQKSFAQVVGERFDKLSEEQRARIDDVADGDPELRWSLLRIIEAAPAVPAAPEQPTAPAIPAPPAPGNTVPAGTPPAPPRPADPESAFGIWQRKQQEDPTGASLYYRMNSVAIERSRPAAS